MKTQMVQIEPYDSLESLVEKVEQADTARVLLLDHSDSDIARNEVKLTRLIRLCLSAGKQVGLVTKDPAATTLWFEKDLSVFSDVITAQQQTWRTLSPSILKDYHLDQDRPAEGGLKLEKPAPHRQLGQGWRVIIFSLAILAVVSLVVILIPSTTIDIYLPRQEEELTFGVQASESYTHVSLAGQIPGTVFSEPVAIVRSGNVSNEGKVAVEKAKGQVQFKNLTERAVTIPAGTVVSTGGENPVAFKTDTAAELAGSVGATILVDTTAIQPGLEANIDAGTIRRVEDALGVNVLVNNPAAMSGGTEADKKIPTNEDRKRIRDQVTQDVMKNVTETIQSKIGLNQWIVPGSYQLGEDIIENYYPNTGMPSDTITIEMNGTAHVLVVNKADLESYINSVLDADPSREYQTLPGSLQVTRVEGNDQSTSGTYRFTVVATRTKIPRPNTSNEAYRIAWKQPEEANSILEKDMRLTQASVIRNRPSWWPWIAALPMQIHIEVK